jgi:hypothetical protein
LALIDNHQIRTTGHGLVQPSPGEFHYTTPNLFFIMCFFCDFSAKKLRKESRNQNIGFHQYCHMNENYKWPLVSPDHSDVLEPTRSTFDPRVRISQSYVRFPLGLLENKRVCPSWPNRITEMNLFIRSPSQFFSAPLFS